MEVLTPLVVVVTLQYIRVSNHHSVPLKVVPLYHCYTSTIYQIKLVKFFKIKYKNKHPFMIKPLSKLGINGD